MTVHHEKPVGVDSYFREIFPGDTVRDLDGKEYTVDACGWARPLDGSTGCGFKKLKDPVFVRGSEQAAVPSKFQKKGGKVGPAVKVEVSGPHGDVPTKEEIAAMPSKEEISAEPAPEKPTRRGGRENKSGVSQLGNLVIRLGFTVKEAREILTAEGIEVFQHGPRHKASIHAEDLPKVRELLAKVRKEEPRPKPIQKPGNHGNHRPNSSGIVRFNNLARSVKLPTWRLRELATLGGFDIVTGGTRDRNDGINREDEARFREFCMATTCKVVAINVQEDAPLSQEDLAAIEEANLRAEKMSALGRFSDPDLAEELRRRGYEVTATKRIEL